MKPRAPGTIADAVTLIKVACGEDAMAREVGKSVGLIRAWADPDDERKPSIVQAIELDCLFRRITGEAPPLLSLFKRAVAVATHPAETPAAQLDLRATVLAMQGDLGDLSRRVAHAHDGGAISTADRAEIAKDVRDLLKTGNTVLDEISHGHLRKRFKT